MSVTLCMLVKNEINRVGGALEDLVDAVDQVLIVDTGSTDGTPDYLRRRFRITALEGSLQRDRCFTLADLRNCLFERAGTDWVLSLDADERVMPESITRLENLPRDAAVDGFFGVWRNYLPGGGNFEDYKLFLFRRHYRHRGLVHDNAQVDMRQRGAHAMWLDGLIVEHHPESRKLPEKRAHYRWRLEQAIVKEPDWLRYRWFLGYMDFIEREWSRAEHLLSRLVRARSNLFPVECLNSAMVLADIYARQARRRELDQLLSDAWEFLNEVDSDFEIAVNHRMQPWLMQAREALDRGALEEIVAYRFAS